MAEEGRLQGMFGAFDRLSTREKVMVGGLGLAFLLAIVAIVWIVVGSQISELEERNEKMREELTEVTVRKDSFLAKRTKVDAEEKQLDENNVRLVNVMERKAQELGVQIEDFREGRKPLTENYRKQKKKKAKGETGSPQKDIVEESQTVTIRKVSLETLARFLDDLENNRNPIRITKLNIDTLQSDRQILREVRVTVSTYRKQIWEN